MTRIRTTDVVSQLRASYEVEARALAGSNTQLSRVEAVNVASDDLRGAISALIDGQPGVRLNVDLVVNEAVKRALERLRSVNTAGTSFVSKAEVDAIKKKLPDLGNRFAQAYDAAKAGVPPTPPEVVNAVKAALTPWAGGSLPNLDVRLVKEARGTREVEVDLHRNDNVMVTARVTLGAANDVQAVKMLTDAHPVTGALVAQLEKTLKGTVLGFVERADVGSGRTETLTAWRDANGAARLSNVNGTTVTPATLGPGDEATARSLAVMMARRQASELVNQAQDDGARLEYHLRTAALKPSQLTRVTDPDESAVGFSPATDAFQFQLSRVWGDNAVFVTFAKNGGVRLEDFN